MAKTQALPIYRRDLGTLLPKLSPIVLKLMRMISDENVSIPEVANVIRCDPAFSGEVLKLANSGLFLRRCAIKSIAHAVVIVGIQRVTSLVITAALWKMLPRHEPHFTMGWWRHSIATALIAEELGSNRENRDAAYTAGLLHAVGQLALFQCSAEGYLAILNQAVSEGGDLLACERESFGVDHAELGRQIAEKWNLPDEIVTAVATHHHPEGPSSAWALGIKEACFAAEYAGFGRCGSHNHVADEDMAAPLAELSEAKFLSEVLPIKLNSIECSLL